MRILGIETSTRILSIALVEGEECLATYNKEGLTHSMDLVPSIKDLLDGVGLSIHDLNGIAVSIGPGSFTGLRIGLATSKGLAYSSGVPLVGVPTLDAIAMGVFSEELKVCAMIEAGTDMVYSAIYFKGERLTEYMTISIGELSKLIKEPTIFVGPALNHFRNLIIEMIGSFTQFSDKALWMPNGIHVARLGLERIKKREIPLLRDILPLYMKQPWVDGRWRSSFGH